MIDALRAHQLLKAVASTAAVLFVGDIDQLPSVGPGQMLADLMGSEVMSVVQLTKVFRQAAASRIVRGVHQINQGQFPSLPAKGEASDFYSVPVETPEAITQTVVDLVKTRLPSVFPFDPVRDIQVLCPMNCSVEKFGVRFGMGDKVMQIENNYDKEVHNGDIGFVAHIDLDEQELSVTFDGQAVTYGFGELDD